MRFEIPNPKFRIRRAFSLVELLIVITVIGLLAALLVPSVNQTLRASTLTSAGQMLVDELNLARQTAISRNAPVEVRLYKLPAHNAPATGALTVYRAVQIFLVQETGAIPVGKPKYFGVPVILTEEPLYSGFFDQENNPEKPYVPGVKVAGSNNYKYLSFQFTSGGSADVQNGKNYFTLVFENAKALSTGANFFTVQVDPITGAVRSFRP